MSGAPPVRPFAAGDIWAQTGTEAAAFDRHAIDSVGVPQPVLMENAGRAAAEVALHVFPEGDVLVFAGSGNNGGDALVVARTLAAAGRNVRLVHVGAGDLDEGLLHGFELTRLGLEDLAAVDASGSVVIDGLLGTGVKGAPRERHAAAIDWINGSEARVVALDVPSGVDSGTGAIAGACVESDLTVSFGAPKVGSLLHPGRGHSGRLVVVDIGFPPGIDEWASANVVTPAWAYARQPRRGTDTHKNREGRVLVVAGQPGMAGAAILCASAAFRSGAGLVRVASVPENRDAIQAGIPEAMFLDAADPSQLEEALESSDAVAVGPGLGTTDTAKTSLATVLNGPSIPCVVDADGLNLLAANAELEGRLAARPSLLTPHPGEIGRLFPDADPGDRIATARAAADRFSAAVLLKGAPSIVAADEMPVTVDTQSTSDLAVAGMGDVLTGVCTTLLAQGVGPRDAGALGLYMTGRAAQIAERGVAMTPTDVLDSLPDALRETEPARTDLPFSFVTFDADPPR